MYGYVYVLVNPSMPGLVKIGKTSKHPTERARELQQTGTPTPFLVAYHVYVNDMDHVEREMHSRLNHSRQATNREFFTVDTTTAINELHDVAREFRSSEDKGALGGYAHEQTTNAYLIKLKPLRASDLTELPITLPQDLLSIPLDHQIWVKKLGISKAKFLHGMVNLYGGGFYQIHRLGLTVLDKAVFKDQIKAMFDELKIAADVEVLRFQLNVPKIDIQEHLESFSPIFVSKELMLFVNHNDGTETVWQRFMTLVEERQTTIGKLRLEAEADDRRRLLRRTIDDFDRRL